MEDSLELRENSLKLIYICSPLKGDVEINIMRANRYCHFAMTKGTLPLAPHTIFTQFLDDRDEDQRSKGRELGLALLHRCEELWCFGDKITEGMAEEIKLAKRLRIPIVYFTDTCERRLQNE